jgi:RraA family protein
MTIGFRILKRRRKVSAALVAKTKGLPVANISDSMSRLFAGGSTLRPMHAGGAMAGPAFTVRARPNDNLMIHKAFDIAEPGDVVVVDAGGELSHALVGELMLSHARKRGIAGVVINGAVRDSGWIRAQDYPVYAAGVTHRGPYKDGPGEINVKLAIGGMVIEPGDLIVGDEDGFLSLPYDDAEAILTAAWKKNDAENKQMQAIEAGTSDRSWVDASLTRLGCEIEK